MIYSKINKGIAEMLNKNNITINKPKKIKRCSFPFQLNDFAFNENIGISETSKNENTNDKIKRRSG